MGEILHCWTIVAQWGSYGPMPDQLLILFSVCLACPSAAQPNTHRWPEQIIRHAGPPRRKECPFM